MVSSQHIDLVVECLEEHKRFNPSFFYSLLKDESRSLNLFWADTISIEDYKCFGDAFTFNMKYKTNKCNLCLGLFCGADHHKSTIIFAADFLSKENIASFVWLFNAFKECMLHAPATMITDQDLAVKAALQLVFPTTFHRLCKWHISNKMCDKVGRLYQNKQATDDFHSIFNNSVSIEKFDDCWEKWMADNKLEGN